MFDELCERKGKRDEYFGNVKGYFREDLLFTPPTLSF